MKILDRPKIQMPSDIDEQCLELCNTLNRLPFVETRESCAGHGNHPYWVFFRCTDMEVISRLGRVVALNYSDRFWEIVLDSVDGDPYGCFWLRTRYLLSDEQLKDSLEQLIESIYYWFDDCFDDYFKRKQNLEEQQ